MNRPALVAVAALAAGTVTACLPPAPPPVVLAQVAYPCDRIHMPGTELGWCVTWTRKDGTRVTGQVIRYNHEVALGIVRR
jgi:hypothetical protein